MEGKIFAYVRISTNKDTQRTDRQLETLQRYSRENNFTIDEIIEERISGTVKTQNRPQYTILKNKLREGNILLITDLDRLGRDVDNTIAELKDLKSQGVRVIALDIPYMNSFSNVQDDSMYNMITDILITLKAHMAHQEREKIVNRINEGLAAAKSKGIKLGRPQAELPRDFIKEYKKFKNGEYGKMSAVGFAKMMRIGRSTLYKYIKIYEEK